MSAEPAPKEVVILGASGGIGDALLRHYAAQPGVEAIHAVSRSGTASAPGPVISHKAEITDEDSLAALAARVEAPDLVIVATGILSDGTALRPEKSLKQQSLPAFEQVFAVNTFGPALVAKHLLPRMPRDRRAVFAALSARVGSISDNRLGGWHAYRASKAALNMLLRNYAIEMARTHPQLICAGLHPGTVDTDLSRPFSRAVPKEKLFTADHAASCLAQVIADLHPGVSGQVFDWAGKVIPA
ncbi:SDR family NAD(P)-dependent oxidoreductase [Phaeobacter sp. PT47_59]|uniref:SDR family NAD(P)-dependent oxidoreductase n=1 Tax=Phaeobacter sp. PT47_59 TaxID=3029979 RepID=UPI00237FEE3E|nr:SDR family NAD(P)-dependent oxidoreductase [Phaeobacter sp. PT47_59]MDE4173399.1 SDR family NAD(P)-dependent oxidoreductase [Phaeobacter sp. PT47_59]